MAPRKTTSAVQTLDPVVPSDSAVETWRNVTPGMVCIFRVGEYGRQVDELIQGGRAFSVTPAERRLNQNLCANRDLDPFVNGTLAPVTLLEEEPDTEILRSNPNNLEEGDIPKLFRLGLEDFENRIGRMTNEAAVARLLETARDPLYRDSVSLAKYEALKMRAIALRGDLETKAPEKEGPGDGQPRPVTPR